MCHFYILKHPMNFAQPYCFMIFTQILLKFCDIEKFVMIMNWVNELHPHFLLLKGFHNNYTYYHSPKCK
jgi:hypothetical protein